MGTLNDARRLHLVSLRSQTQQCSAVWQVVRTCCCCRLALGTNTCFPFPLPAVPVFLTLFSPVVLTC